MNDLGKRFSTGVVFSFVIVGLTVFSAYSFAFVWLSVALFGQIEFYKLIKKSGGNPQTTWGVIAGFILFTSTFLFLQNDMSDYKWILINPLLLFVVFLVEIYRTAKNPFLNIAYTLTGIIYIALPFTMLNFMVTDISSLPNYEFSPWILVGVILTMWANDSWAYLIGSMIGKHKLFPSISPGKTWEGFAGGIVCSWLWSLLMYWILENVAFFGFRNIEWFDWIVLASILSIVGTLGDLVESKLKRSLSIKDSGNILPGHGGILDRFDALLLAIPFILFYLLLRY